MKNRTYYVILNKEDKYLSTEINWIPEGDSITATYTSYIEWVDEFNNLTEIHDFIEEFDKSKESYKGSYAISNGEIELGSIEKVTKSLTKEKVLIF